MKKIYISLCIVCLTVFVGYGQESSDYAPTKTIEITIEGMACQEGCADKINANLLNLEGIQNSSVSFESGKALLTFDPEKNNLENIKKTIVSTKVKSYTYTITNIEIKDQ